MKDVFTFLTDFFTSESKLLILFAVLSTIIIFLCVKAILLSNRYRQVMLDLPVVQNNTIKWRLSDSITTLLQKTLNFLPRMIFGKLTFDFVDIIFIYSSMIIAFLGIKYLLNVIF